MFYFYFNCFGIILEKYDVVGKILKPGEVPTNYSEEVSSSSDKKQD